MVRKPRAPRPTAKKQAGAANSARGEHMLTLAGVAYKLRPTWAASKAIEANFETSLLDLTQQAGELRLGCDEIATILAEWIKAGAAPDDKLTANVTAEGLSKLVYEEGMVKVLGVTLVVLQASVNGGHTASGEAKPVTTI